MLNYQDAKRSPRRRHFPDSGSNSQQSLEKLKEKAFSYMSRNMLNLMKSGQDSLENEAKAAYTGSPLAHFSNQHFMKQKTMNFNLVRKKTLNKSASLNITQQQLQNMLRQNMGQQYFQIQNDYKNQEKIKYLQSEIEKLKTQLKKERLDRRIRHEKMQNTETTKSPNTPTHHDSCKTFNFQPIITVNYSQNNI